MMSSLLWMNSAGVLRSDSNFNRVHNEGVTVGFRGSKMKDGLGTIQII